MLLEAKKALFRAFPCNTVHLLCISYAKWKKRGCILDHQIRPPADSNGARGPSGTYFADLGHRRVAQLRGPVDVANFPRRASGFSAACAKAGIEEVHVHEAAGLPIIDEGRRIMLALIDQASGLPSAVFAQNDLMALGALSLLRGNGIGVPDDVSLAGYNNLPTVGHVSPSLTTVNYPSMDVGRIAGEMILNLLAGDSVEDVVLEPELVVRQSTRPKA